MTKKQSRILYVQSKINLTIYIQSCILYVQSDCELTIWNLDTLIKFFFLLSTPVIFLTTSMFSFYLQADNLDFWHINQALFFSSPVNDRCFNDSKTFEPRPLVLHCFVSPSQLLRGFSSSRQSMYRNVNKWFLYYFSFSASCLLQLIWGWLVAIICQVQ